MRDLAQRPARFASLIVLIVGFVFLQGTSWAQFGQIAPRAGEIPASVRATAVPAAAFPGEQVRLDVTVDVDDGWVLYAMDTLVPVGEIGPIRTVLSIRDAGGLEEIEGEDWTEPEPLTKIDPGFEVRVAYFEGEATFSRKMRVPEDASSGPITVEGTINFQVCELESGFCINTRPPKPWTARVLVRAGDKTEAELAEAIEAMEEEAEEEAAEVADDAPTTEEVATDDTEAAVEAEQEDIDATTLAAAASDEQAALAALDAPERRTFDTSVDLLGGGLWRLAWVAFLAGLLTLLTPCVFPMIPITISFFTKRAHHGAAKRVGLCSVYGGSIVAGFAVLGFGLALLLRAAGAGTERAGLIAQMAANPWMNLLLGGLFIAFGLSLLGMFDISLPNSWANKLQKKKSGRGDVLGAVILSVVFVMVSFTCTAPIVGPLIILTFGENWLRPFVGLTAYGAGLALPFFLLGLVPGMVNALPKSGDWLNATKVTMGLVEIAAAMKFFSNVDLVWLGGMFLTYEVVLASWTAIALIIALYLLGSVQMTTDAGKSPIGAMRMTFAAGFGTLGLYLAVGLFGGSIHPQVESFLPPVRSGGGFGSVATTAGGTGNPGGTSAFIKNDLESAKELAAAQNKPLFIDFTGYTCTNCRLNEINYFSRPSVQEMFSNFVLVALYTDDRVVGERYQNYQVERFETFALPFYAIVSPDDSEVLATFAGLIRNEAQFLEFLEAGLGG